MKEFNYTITDPMGIHARPAGLLIKEAAKYPCAITITSKGKEVDAKKIFGVMSLGVKQGTEVAIKADGDQEEEAIKAMEAFMKENL